MSKSLEKLRKRLNELSTSIEGNVAFLYELDSVIRNDSYDLDNVDKYLELLTIVDFDKPYAIFRSRCDRSIYDKFKTRSEINGSYEISDENRLNCVNAAFTFTSLSDEDKIRFVNDASNLICDKMLKEDRISILQSLLANKLKDRIMIDTDGRRLFYRKDGKVKTISGSEVKDRFLEFCKSRNIEISDRSLNSTLEDYFKLERKKIYASKIILPEDFDESLKSKSFSAWVKSN